MKIAKRQSANNWMTGIRKRLGLSQQQLADQLNVSRITITKSEQGKRSLPTNALLKLVQLETKLSAKPEQSNYECIHPSESELISKCKRSYELMFARESASLLNSRKLAEKLQVMTGLYLKAREWLDIIEQYIQENNDDPVALQRWKKQEQSAVKTLHKCGLPIQTLLKSRIAVLEAEAELYKEMKERLKKELPDYFK